MRLEKLKLNGFKSFVDPTVIELRSALAGVVGPNGCGKSNVIDAVRWVMGESSAKTLRGESMDDVIFSGSSARKPVGKASVELLFDNSDGSLGGEYAKYSEIAIRREVTRDGQSSYFLNGTRCRRRDIKDIFLGTGLGPRSYAIIQQGTISRVIEAKPDELRVFIEEAAGISRYKERRRETENRMRHTRENLERVNDIREELTKQLERLKRQSRAAERFKELKIKQRELQARLYALKLNAIDEKLASQKTIISEKEVSLEAAVAQIRKCDNQIETYREKHVELTDEFNEVQKNYYNVGSEIVRLEQSLQHGRDRAEQFQHDLSHTEAELTDVIAHQKTDAEKMLQLNQTIDTLTPQITEAEQYTQDSLTQLTTAEDDMKAWQLAWDAFNQEAAKASEQAQVEQTRIQQLELRIEEACKRLDVVKQEQNQLDDSELKKEIAELIQTRESEQQVVQQIEQQLQHTIDRIKMVREEHQQLRNKLHELQSQLQKSQGRFASLEALQQAALGQQEKSVVTWLEKQGLADYPRLAQRICVENGFEKAVETVLGTTLEAVCLPGSENFDALFTTDYEQLTQANVTLINSSQTDRQPQTRDNALMPLSQKIQAEFTLSWLFNIFVADDLNQALSQRHLLTEIQSIVTKDGLWLGTSWLRIAKDSDVRSGVLAREHELKALTQTMSELQQAIETVIRDCDLNEETLRDLELKRDQEQADLNQQKDSLHRVQAQITVKEGRCEQLAQRFVRLQVESETVLAKSQENRDVLDQARQVWQAALSLMETQADQRDSLQMQRTQKQQALDTIRPQAREAKDKLHQLTLQLRSNETELNALTRTHETLQQRLNNLTQRKTRLSTQLEQALSPLDDIDQQLQATLTQRRSVEEIMQQARDRLHSVEAQLREQEHDRSDIESHIETLRSELESQRLASQADSVHRTNISEQLAQLEQTLEAVLARVELDQSVDSIDNELNQIGQRIQRLGAINLAAIEEFETESERKQHLDSQYDDLSEALATLEAAIRKIDRETKERFKTTFDTINNHFRELFPSLFGGGEAYLELTGDDLLDTGVTVMARPPGKRNSSIHLLSGGEKALTAISLVFAIFKLTPAPFCMLDEVDAPLDDANVGRFCQLVKKIAETIQVIFISHNKVAIEMANQLMGVTMHEPGVSRLVAVDIDEAVAMAQDNESAKQTEETVG